MNRLTSVRVGIARVVSQPSKRKINRFLRNRIAPGRQRGEKNDSLGVVPGIVDVYYSSAVATQVSDQLQVW